MQIELEVHNPAVESELSVHDTKFIHVGCGPLSYRREFETDRHSLKCGCGLEISFEKHGAASATIIDVTIDEQTRVFPTGSYSSKPEASVRVAHRTSS